MHKGDESCRVQKWEWEVKQQGRRSGLVPLTTYFVQMDTVLYTVLTFCMEVWWEGARGLVSSMSDMVSYPLPLSASTDNL